MRKLKNPYTQMDGYNCFGCSPDNQNGLQMHFFDDGEYICSEWKPNKSFQGYKNVLHGGIQVTLMDEIASWVVQSKLGTAGVTSKIESRFLKPVLITDEHITIKAKLHRQMKNIAIIEVQLFNFAGELCAHSQISYFTFNPELAKEKYFYPGTESFY